MHERFNIFLESLKCALECIVSNPLILGVKQLNLLYEQVPEAFLLVLVDTRQLLEQINERVRQSF